MVLVLGEYRVYDGFQGYGRESSSCRKEGSFPSEVVHVQRIDIERDRMLLRVNQGKGRKDRSPLLSARLLTALRTSWKLYRPSLWLLPGQHPTTPRPLGTAQKIS